MSGTESVIAKLQERLKTAQNMLAKPEVPLGMVGVWSSQVRSDLEQIFGRDAPVLASLPQRGIDRSIKDPRAELERRVALVRRYIEALERVPTAATAPTLGKKIFIGHGRSLVWYQLKDFLRDTLELPCDEFNVEPAPGLTTTERLQAMLEDAALAFIVMTAEEHHVDGSVCARPNVIHESGLFQGKLGIRRAIVMLEKGCSDFSNIKGLTQIRFPKDDMRPAFEQVRQVLRREKVI
jgi:hypothetical protein